MGRHVSGCVGSLVAFSALLVGCSPPLSEPVVLEDVVAFEPPPGYEVRRVDVDGGAQEWRVTQWFSRLEEEEGAVPDGSGILIRSGIEVGNSTKPSVETFEQYCAGLPEAVGGEPGVSRVEVLPDRRFDDATACGVAWQDKDGDNRQVVMRWDLCRRDGCWSFEVRGARGSDVISGDFLSFLQTVRFVPEPSEHPDLVFPSPSATQS